MFEDIFGKQDDDLKLDEIINLSDEEWDTGEVEPKNDTWNTGRDDSGWTVG